MSGGPNLDALPSIECQCGRRIYIDTVHRQHYEDVKAERDAACARADTLHDLNKAIAHTAEQIAKQRDDARAELERVRHDYAGALLDVASLRRAGPRAVESGPRVPHLTPDKNGVIHVMLDEDGVAPGFTTDTTQVTVRFYRQEPREATDD